MAVPLSNAYDSLRRRVEILGFFPTARIGTEGSRSFEVLLERPKITGPQGDLREVVMPGGTSSVIAVAVLFGLYSLVWLVAGGQILGNPWREFGVSVGPVVVLLVWWAAWARRFVRPDAIRVKFESLDARADTATAPRVALEVDGAALSASLAYPAPTYERGRKLVDSAEAPELSSLLGESNLTLSTR